MEIIANHAHLMPKSNDPDWPAGDSDMLLDHLDFCGIGQAVVFPPFACQMDNDRRLANTWAWDQVKQDSDRFIAAGNLAPAEKDALDLLDLFHSEGIHLAKVHPSIDVYDVSDPAARDCYAKAAELGILLNFHTGPHRTRLSLAEPSKFDDLLWDFPNLRLLFEHFGGRTYFEQFMAIISNHEPSRAFGGITSVLSYENHRIWYLGAERITELFECVGGDQLVYGLDFPWNSRETNRQDIEILKELNIPAEAKSKILGGNLKRILSLQ